MLNKKNRVEAVENLKRVIKKFENEKTYMVTQSEKLYKERLVLKDNVKKVWQFLNSMRNKPEYINIEVEKLKIEFKKFENFVIEINEEVEASLKKTAGGAGSGVAAGVGVAAFGPSAAMAIATTFGTASTGTAISALSGAAATNAALAWLGGGALVAGGGGTAAGSALLALSGPIGWTIGGVSLATAGLFRNSKNKKVANEARTKEIEVHSQIKMLKGTSEEIIETTKLTETTNTLIDPFYDDVLNRTVRYKSDYKEIKEARDNELIKDLGSLINQTKGATELLNRAIGKES
ncbi:DNA polymerase III subunit gamma/tau [Staphylococcus xylosus]|uniref:DNA polymerase III subunit gamma/tau n=1 Tax=Staphylococcus xylosus TaxID=1288 RepID=UPI00164261F0|nr:DNA polymerase III subunit gamma/tau [Staphylococcus xylosus]MEB7507584.1 DNA polymerase III subunit gamma/tau [Staphylococcus xylosus]